MRVRAGQRRFVLASIAAGAVVFFSAATILFLKPVTRPLRVIAADAQAVRVIDRHGVPLTASYQNRWNSFDHVSLYEAPEFLTAAFIASEDRRFFDHGGIDWRARAGATAQNIRQGKIVRGASTISEQVVRMINPRPRTLWSKWLEGIEAAFLERAAGKAEILEFYINQVPYAANRRGVAQAARYYFGRDLSTLSRKEMLALAILARAPSGYDLYRHPGRIEAAIDRLAAHLEGQGKIDPIERRQIKEEKIETMPPPENAEARHFVRYARREVRSGVDAEGRALRTTLDSRLQAQVQDILDRRVRDLERKNLRNGAALVADHQTGEVLAWVVAGARQQDENKSVPAAEIDAVLTPRQPGSSMKPFLYAQAMENGWTAAALLDDSPLAEAIGTGLHRFRNYSNTYYGPVTLREALGNSLNIPALKTIRYVGAGPYLSALQALGFASLDKSSEIYDEGLALGVGEVTLFELVQGYMALAHRGVYRPLKVVVDDAAPVSPRRVFSGETASIIADILSDPAARAWEFGEGSVLNLPVQTAVKTGTSTDYRDAWAVGFNDRYVVGLWMGNLDNAPMNEVTGSTGPALALRGIFSLLNRGRETQPLYMSPRLVRQEVCARPAKEDGICAKKTEWFAPDVLPQENAAHLPARRAIELVRPTDGLQMALDPRVPAAYQKFRFELAGLEPGMQAVWMLDGDVLAETEQAHILWPVERGRHKLSVRIEGQGRAVKQIGDVEFVVK